MAEKAIDLAVSSKLKEQGYKDKEIHYGYSLPADGNQDFTPKSGERYCSKSGKTTRSEFEYLIFAGPKRQKTERLILIEDKDNESSLGSEKDIHDIKKLYKLAVTDGFHYGYELLSKTEEIKSIFVIAVAGESLKSSAIFIYKNSSIIDRYSNYVSVPIDDNISYIFIEKWNDWEELSKNKFDKYINEEILCLNSPDNEINLAHIRSVAGKLSNTIDKKLKLDPFKRLLLVSGLLLGINEDENIIKSFSKSYGASDLYSRIEGALPDSKFSSDKKKQLLNSFSFIKHDKKITTELINQKTKKSEGYPLALISKELRKPSAVGYSVLDLMKQSSHIDLLGNLFDVFTKYMSVGGASGDIVLTPNHITKFMAEVIDVNPRDNIVDITVGTAGFLISAMTIMEEKVDSDPLLTVKEKVLKKKNIKENQLWGVEYDDNMYATAVTNMLLHGDGKSHIFHGDSISKRDLTSGKTFSEIFENVTFNKLLFNPPYDNQDLFVKNGLDILGVDGKAAIIIPKQTFNKGGAIVEDIFSNHRLEAVFDLPQGQFKKKNGTVGTDVAIFIFTAHHQHNFEKDYVTFVKLLKDEVGTKGNLKGVASEKTEIIYKKLLEFSQSDYRNLALLESENYFKKPLTTLIKKGKYMYKDYEPSNEVIPEEEDFIETIGAYLEFLLSEEKRSKKKGGGDEI
ncbi:N-6 DNA methylase [Lactococcus lactis subsp. lactis]|uniref:HsdM family class I SAM-dependent methyltransferase n=1 Tax=Lactococcus lactis TaxID=1358 RepID=UPI00338DC1AF